MFYDPTTAGYQVQMHSSSFLTRLSRGYKRWIVRVIGLLLLFIVAALALLPEMSMHVLAAHASSSKTHPTVKHSPGSVMRVSPVNLKFGIIQGNSTVQRQVITIKNSSSKMLYWRFAPMAHMNTWCTVTPASGKLTSRKYTYVTVSVAPSRLKPGMYSAQVVVVGTNDQNKIVVGSPLMINVTLFIYDRGLSAL